jgi:hypothetical protein
MLKSPFPIFTKTFRGAAVDQDRENQLRAFGSGYHPEYPPCGLYFSGTVAVNVTITSRYNRFMPRHQRTVMNPLTVATFIVLAVGCGCGLSHSSAQSVLEHASEFTVAKEAVLWTGKAALFSPQDPLYPALTELGLIEVRVTEQGMPTIPCFPVLKAVVRLTQDEQARVDWKRLSEGKWAVPLANRTCTIIVGIRKVSDNSSEVQFEWKWRLTRYGEAVSKQRSEIERRHKDLFDQLGKLRSAKEEYEHSHAVWMVGREQSLSFTTKAITEDYERNFRQQLIDGSRVYQSVAVLHKFDTGWQLGQQGEQQLKDSLNKAEQAVR